MAHLFQPSLIPALDSNGNPISGALMHFYQSGTLTPVTIFTSHQETAAHRNPVEAGSSGRFPPIYLKATQVHRVRLTDANGVLIPQGDIDPVNVADPLGPKVEYYRFGGFAVTPPYSGEVLCEHVSTDNFMLPADMLGSVGHVGTPPAAPYALSVKRGNTTIGAIKISSGGAVLFETIGHAPISVGVGQVLSVVSPDVPDESLARLSFTLKGVL
jgi:hypothetical protein